MNQEIEVGEVKEDGLRFWCARLALEYAKEEAKRLDEAVQRLKNRGNSLIGWTVTISIALSAIFFTHSAFQFVSLIMLICMLTTALFSVMTLYSTPWIYTNIKFNEMNDFQDKFETELEIVENLTLEYEKDNMLNALKYYKLQEAMQWAWIFFFMAPLIGFTIQMIIF